MGGLVSARMIERRPDWLDRLTVYLDEISGVPYDAVQHNCATFALGVVEAVTGELVADVLARLEITLPTSELGVARLLTDRGGMRGIACAAFGCEPEPGILSARRGDIALFEGIDGDTLGVVENGGAICLTPEGLWRFEISEARGFWRVGA